MFEEEDEGINIASMVVKVEGETSRTCRHEGGAKV